MSSIADMVNFAFRKQIFNWLRECEGEDENTDFTLYRFHNSSTGHYNQLKVGFCERQLTFCIYDDTIDEYEDDIYSKYIHSICMKKQDELEITKLSCEIARFTRHFIQNKKCCCDNCNLPFNFVSEMLSINSNKGNLIDNYCQECEKTYISRLNSWIIKGEHKMEEISCDICYEKCLEKVGDDKIKLTRLYEVTCCKGKYMCYKCRNKMEDGKCFFCRQDAHFQVIMP